MRYLNLSFLIYACCLVSFYWSFRQLFYFRLDLKISLWTSKMLLFTTRSISFIISWSFFKSDLSQVINLLFHVHDHMNGHDDIFLIALFRMVLSDSYLLRTNSIFISGVIQQNKHKLQITSEPKSNFHEPFIENFEI